MGPGGIETKNGCASGASSNLPDQTRPHVNKALFWINMTGDGNALATFSESLHVEF
jgi:hypothetical protein